MVLEFLNNQQDNQELVEVYSSKKIEEFIGEEYLKPYENYKHLFAAKDNTFRLFGDKNLVKRIPIYIDKNLSVVPKFKEFQKKKQKYYNSSYFKKENTCYIPQVYSTLSETYKELIDRVYNEESIKGINPYKDELNMCLDKNILYEPLNVKNKNYTIINAEDLYDIHILPFLGGIIFNDSTRYDIAHRLLIFNSMYFSKKFKKYISVNDYLAFYEYRSRVISITDDVFEFEEDIFESKRKFQELKKYIFPISRGNNTCILKLKNGIDLNSKDFIGKEENIFIKVTANPRMFYYISMEKEYVDVVSDEYEVSVYDYDNIGYGNMEIYLKLSDIKKLIDPNYILLNIIESLLPEVERLII